MGSHHYHQTTRNMISRFCHRWFWYMFLCTLTIIQILLTNNLVDARNAFEAIKDNPELSQFREIFEAEQIYPIMLQSWQVTIFAPTNDAMTAFKNRNKENFDMNLFKYHLVSTLIKRESFPTSPMLTSINGQYAPLFLSVVNDSIQHSNSGQQSEITKSYYVNNALILDAIEDLKTSSNQEQSLFIIDEVLTFFKPTKNVPPNALEFIKEPSVYGINADLSQFLKHVQSNKLESLFSTPGAHSFFIPSKVSSEQNTPEFDDYVIKSHVIKSKALFVRTMGDLRNYNTLAYDGNVDVELAFVNKTVRFTSEQIYYVQTNTIKNDAVHRAGRVLSRLITYNIPVKNGVVHIIGKPLMLMDMSVKDFIREQPKLKRFYKLLEKHSRVLDAIYKNPNKTVLAPDDNAFANLMDNNQNFAGIGEDSKEMEKLLLQHFVEQQVSSSDLKRSSGYANITSAGDVPVVFRLVGSGHNSRLTVESGGVNATSLLSDFGASDGIVHIIDRILGMPFNSIYEKMLNDPVLNETIKIGSQGGTQNWNAKLADQNKRYTFFAPSNQAWYQFGQENPSEFKQLDNGLYPAISRAILDRHLSAKGQFNKKDLEQTVRKVDSIQGELIVSPDPVTRDIYIEWEGRRAKIIKSDIYGQNGVVHVIDQVLAKRRDFKVNGASSIHCHQLSYQLLIPLIMFYSIMGLFI